MKLDETRWVLGGGVDAEWRRVGQRRLDAARAGLKAALARLAREAPASVRASKLPDAARWLLRARGARADRALGHPCFDYWLSLWDSHFSRPCPEAD